MKDINYEDRLKIDRNSLDDELIEQAAIFFEVAEAASYAASERDEAYSMIKEIEAELTQSERERLIQEENKVTEKMVESAVRNHDDYVKAVRYHLKMKKKADRLTALKESFHQRSYMLRDLVQLYISGYFMDESIKGGQAMSRSDVEFHNQTKAVGRQRRERKRAQVD